jgi:CRISPR/Cas system-associated endonuclease Cas1
MASGARRRDGEEAVTDEQRLAIAEEAFKSGYILNPARCLLNFARAIEARARVEALEEAAKTCEHITGFARAIEARVRVEALEEAAKTCEQAIQLCADHIRALAEGMG